MASAAFMSSFYPSGIRRVSVDCVDQLPAGSFMIDLIDLTLTLCATSCDCLLFSGFFQLTSVFLWSCCFFLAITCKCNLWCKFFTCLFSPVDTSTNKTILVGNFLNVTLAHGGDRITNFSKWLQQLGFLIIYFNSMDWFANATKFQYKNWQNMYKLTK